MPGLWTQIKEFILMAVVGIMIAGIFHVYQRLLVKARTRRGRFWLPDLLIWLFLIVLVFAALLVVNQGDLRFYVILGLIVGGIIYAVYIKPKTNRFVDRFAGGVTAAATAAVKILLKPLALIAARRGPPPGDSDDGPK